MWIAAITKAIMEKSDGIMTKSNIQNDVINPEGANAQAIPWFLETQAPGDNAEYGYGQWKPRRGI